MARAQVRGARTSHLTSRRWNRSGLSWIDTKLALEPCVEATNPGHRSFQHVRPYFQRAG